jgi:hypothetical protein
VTTRLQLAAKRSIVVGIDPTEQSRRALAVALPTASRLFAPADRAAPDGAPEWYDGPHGSAGAEQIPAVPAARS